MKTNFWLAATLVVVFSGCGSIERTTSSQQPVDKVLVAGIGDVVLRIDRERSLTNVVGKADIWGRKTNEGFSEIRFAGVESNSQVVFYRKDVQIMSNETMLTRTPMSFTSASANTAMSGNATAYGNTAQLSDSSRTVGSAATISSGSEYHVAVPSDTFAIRLGPNERLIPISGYVIEILSVEQNAIKYRVTKQPQ